MPKFRITWGIPPTIARLTEDEKLMLLAKLDAHAATANAFEITLNRAELRWIKKSLKNGCIEILTRSSSVGTSRCNWVAIGTSKLAITKLKRTLGLVS